MTRDEVLRRLNAHRPELERRFGVCSLALLGSHARDEAQPGSDVDLLVEFEGDATWRRYNDVLDYLEDVLGSRVDLGFLSSVKPRIRPYVEREMIRVA